MGENRRVLGGVPYHSSPLTYMEGGMNTCVDCGKEIGPKSIWCRQCAGRRAGKLSSRKKPANLCIDCEMEIGQGAMRCVGCYRKSVEVKYYCVDCGKEVSWNVERCWGCHVKRIEARTSYCIDCGKEIRAGNERCWDCYNRFRKVEPNYCMDCGKEISQRSIRCLNCAAKERGIIQRVQRGTKSKNHCIDCDKEITVCATRCVGCAIETRRGEKREPRKPPNYCAACGIEIGRRAKYCSECVRRAPEVRQKLSIASRRNWKDPDFRRRVRAGQAITFATEEFRAKKSASAKDAWARGAWDGVNFHPGAPYKTELNVAEVLDWLGVDYQDQYSVGCKRYDFFLPDYNLLIEYDGWYWHKSNWAIENGATERDVKKNKLAEQLGFDLIRLAGLPRRDLTQEEIMIQLLDHLGDRLWA